jgi:hypothetical protein
MPNPYLIARSSLVRVRAKNVLRRPFEFPLQSYISAREKVIRDFCRLPLGAIPREWHSHSHVRPRTPGAWRKGGVRPAHDTGMLILLAITTIPGFDSAQSNTLDRETLQIHVSDHRLYPTSRALPSDFCLVPSSVEVSRIYCPSILACERSITLFSLVKLLGVIIL